MKNMIGLHRELGTSVPGIDHLRQSIIDILSTPIGSRVMRRDYGSRLYELVDAPLNRETVVDIYAATAEALLKWEPRLNVTRVYVEQLQAGKISLSVEGVYLPSSTPIQLENIRV